MNLSPTYRTGTRPLCPAAFVGCIVTIMVVVDGVRHDAQTWTFATEAEAIKAAVKAGCEPGAHEMGSKWMPGLDHRSCSPPPEDEQVKDDQARNALESETIDSAASEISGKDAGANTNMPNCAKFGDIYDRFWCSLKSERDYSEDGLTSDEVSSYLARAGAEFLGLDPSAVSDSTQVEDALNSIARLTEICKN